jgi:hypothetical protein
MSVIRKPAAAGYFYPSDPDELKENINLLLADSHPPVSIQNVLGIISPHAGYVYSGKTAAYAYNLISGNNVETAVIISPSHREYFQGISIYDGDVYETPLGKIRLNNVMSEKLAAGGKSIFRGRAGHNAEHAIEVQLPFLQVVLKEFEIVPIVMGDQNERLISELASKLSEVVDDKTLVVASSDLSHYHSKATAYKLDSIVERRIIDFDYEKLKIDLEKGNCEACGGGPIAAMMQCAAILKKGHSIILHRSDSGDTSGDNREVVGYLSAAVYGD